MTKAIFLFISCFVLLLSVFAGGIEFSNTQQMVVSMVLICTVGIPHGAIDNVLFLSDNKVSTLRFYLVYLGAIGLNLAIWLIIPVAAYAIFLLISAFHFGQSQFSHYLKKENLAIKALYLLWGVSLLMGLTWFNIDEILVIGGYLEEFSRFETINNASLVAVLFIASSVGTLGLMLYLFIEKMISLEHLALEVLTLLLVFLSFHLFPLLIGFTLYFATLHSFKVLREEYNYLESRKMVRSFFSFVKMVLPYTLVSIAGIVLILFLVQSGVVQLSYAYCILILISSITVPHAFVMHRFYNPTK